MAIPSTIQEQIDAGLEKEFKHRSFNGSCLIEDSVSGNCVKIPMNSLVSKYKEYFDDYLVTCPLTDEEKNKYRYAPKKLSEDLYSTTEYWSVLLFLNGKFSILDFDLDEVKIIPPGRMESLMNEIMIMEGVLE